MMTEFDIVDVMYIYKFLMGTLIVDENEFKEKNAIAIGESSRNWQRKILF